METFGGRDAFVIGAGISGFVSALLLLREGARVTLFDERPKEDVERSLGHPVPPQIAFVHGMMTEKAALETALRALSPRVFVGGNLGIPFASAAGGSHVWAVVEVSSFQLETIDSFRPSVAVLLNITEDHRDRCPDFSTYAATKMGIFRHQGPADVALVSADARA